MERVVMILLVVRSFFRLLAIAVTCRVRRTLLASMVTIGRLFRIREVPLVAYTSLRCMSAHCMTTIAPTGLRYVPSESEL